MIRAMLLFWPILLLIVVGIIVEVIGQGIEIAGEGMQKCGRKMVDWALNLERTCY